jgi:hypothetical protein
MSDGKSLIEEKGPSLIRSSSTKNTDDGLAGPYLFISFDLVNSTLYKSQNPNWPEVFHSFMESCSYNLKKCVSGDITVYEWKRQGDEILFYIAHPSCENLLKLPADVYSTLKFIINGLTDYNKDSVVQLSVKATLWSAVISDKNPGNNEIKLFNVITVEETPYKKILDFLGPDIDTGFRIAKYASPGKLVIDAYLAWYISQYDSKQSNNITDNMRIVSLEDLKGVWNGRRYPIIWYTNDWTNEDTVFQYDEEYSSEIVKRIKEKGMQSLQKSESLDKILKEVNLLNYAKQFDENIKKYSDRPFTQPKLSPKRAELHLVAICKNTENKILIFKRSDRRSYLPGCWEFGCTYLKYEQNIFNSLKNGYKEKYNISITVDDQSMPVAYYEVERGELRIPGFIYHAIIEGDAKISYDREKYSYHKLVNIHDIPEIKDNEAVPGFHERIKKYLA